MGEAVNHYDVLVLGSGEGGKYIAWKLAAKRKRTAVIERRWTGGSCLNIACLPSKNVIYSAKVSHLASQAKLFGLRNINVAETLDIKAVVDRERDMVKGLV
jgi:pyruvate/2-oxoglutarate dehydrogenase complex dihydrolipoamide dehydrogenase (E3) component